MSKDGENPDESQAIEGYLCACGKVCDTLTDLRKHFLEGGSADGKGIHKSRGRVNKQTGEIVMPPWEERTPEQKAASSYGLKKGKGKDSAGSRQTIDPSTAQEIKFVPRVLTADYSPVIRSGQAAAANEWGGIWVDMPLGDFIDTIIYSYFKDRGITLAGYIVEEPEPEPEEAGITQGG